MTLGELLKNERIKRGWSRRVACMFYNEVNNTIFSISQMSDYESDRNLMSYVVLLNFGRLYGLDLNQLYKVSDPNAVDATELSA